MNIRTQLTALLKETGSNRKVLWLIVEEIEALQAQLRDMDRKPVPVAGGWLGWPSAPGLQFPIGQHALTFVPALPLAAHWPFPQSTKFIDMNSGKVTAYPAPHGITCSDSAQKPKVPFVPC